MSIIIFFLLLLKSALAQDSLHLVTTIIGKNINEPIVQVNGLGDINGDGFDEFAVKNLNGLLYSEYFDIYLGDDSIEFNNEYSFYGFVDDKESYIGSPVGDVNNDGFDDFIMSIHNFGGNRRQIYLFLGEDLIDTIPDLYYEGNLEVSDWLVPSSHGDINNDGYNDFSIRSIIHPSNSTGRIHVFLGGAEIADTPSAVFHSDSAKNLADFSESIAGDINGDGLNDLIILWEHYNLDSTQMLCELIFGSDNFPSNNSYSFIPPRGGNVEVIGDFNADGYDDFYFTNSNRVFFGSANFSEENYITLSLSGETAGTAGDINNDGYDDLIIGYLNHYNSGQTMVGGVYVYLGGADPDTNPTYILEGETKWSNFGREVGTLGDINGDGYDELFVLADGYPNYENPLGKIYIYSMKNFVVGVEEKFNKILTNFKLNQNYPNPFNPRTTIRYEIPEQVRNDNMNVKIIVYDVLGRKIETLVNKHNKSGNYEIEFDGSSLPSGIYYYQLNSESIILTKKMVLLK
jgi:hypothetical protein